MVELDALRTGAGQDRGLLVRKEVQVRLDAVGGVLAEREDAQRHPRVRGGDRHVDRRAVADPLAARLRGVGVEHGREEDRTARGVEVEGLRRVGREPEAVLGRPLADGRAAAPEDGDVQGVDLDLLEDLGGPLRTGRTAHRVEPRPRWVRLADETLERPIAPALDRGRDAGERYE